MQRLLAYILLWAFSFQCFSQLGIVAQFRLNREYITRVLCINKDKPSMHCDGKCYLKKKIRKEAERQQDNNNSGNSKVQNDFVGLEAKTPLSMYGLPDTHRGPYYSPAYPLLLQSREGVFHPPCYV